jgi:hypothetical protein
MAWKAWSMLATFLMLSSSSFATAASVFHNCLGNCCYCYCCYYFIIISIIIILNQKSGTKIEIVIRLIGNDDCTRRLASGGRGRECEPT